MSLRREAQYSYPDVVLPSGALAFQAQAGLGLVGGIQTNQVEDNFLQEGEILWGVVLAYGAGILAKAVIEHPVKAVASRPEELHPRQRRHRADHHVVELIPPTADRPAQRMRRQRLRRRRRPGPAVRSRGVQRRRRQDRTGRKHQRPSARLAGHRRGEIRRRGRGQKRLHRRVDGHRTIREDPLIGVVQDARRTLSRLAKTTQERRFTMGLTAALALLTKRSCDIAMCVVHMTHYAIRRIHSTGTRSHPCG
jgi:hypothetical protein